jgi:hypothetical protein
MMKNKVTGYYEFTSFQPPDQQAGEKFPPTSVNHLQEGLFQAWFGSHVHPV